MSFIKPATTSKPAHPSIIKKIFLYCLLLFFMCPVFLLLFKAFISIKEPQFIPPLAASKAIVIRSDAMGDGHFGARRSNGSRRHKGLDIHGKIGDTVVAAKSGIARVGEVPYGMGKYIIIYHFDGYATLYGHLKLISIKDKRWVWQGQKIGEMGKSGNSNHKRITPHLHFEIRKDNIQTDPLAYLTNNK